MVDVVLNYEVMDWEQLRKAVVKARTRGHFIWIRTPTRLPRNAMAVLRHEFSLPKHVHTIHLSGSMDAEAVIHQVEHELSSEDEDDAGRILLLTTDTDDIGMLPDEFRMLDLDDFEERAAAPDQRDVPSDDAGTPPARAAKAGFWAPLRHRSVQIGVPLVFLLVATSFAAVGFFHGRQTPVAANAATGAEENVIAQSTVETPPSETEAAMALLLSDPEPPQADQAESDQTAQAETRTVRFAKYGSNVRSGPGTQYAITGTITKGAELQVLGPVEETGWALVEVSPDEKGYVFAPLLAEELAQVYRAESLSFRDCEACPEMVFLPAGSFLMGSPTAEPGRTLAEGPQHAVTIPQPLAVSKYEITFEEWDRCVAEGGCEGYRPDDEGWGRGSRPVVNVSWNDAKNYTAWLRAKTGKRYRLLSEAEWEYAARGGTQSPYAYGTRLGLQEANFTPQDRAALYADAVSAAQTRQAGSFPANPFGLYDVHGNVSEWTEDCWSQDYMGATVDGLPVVRAICAQRVIRGGSWKDPATRLRAAFRTMNAAAGRFNTIGFRIAREL